MLPWQRDDTYQLYEFACHEANISIGNALRGERLLEQKAAETAAKGTLPIDQTSAGLIGATEAAIRSKLGEPSSVEFNGTRWTYQTVGGGLVLHLFFAENKVKAVAPNDLPLDALSKR